MKKEYQSELLEAIHETAAGLHKIGVIDTNEMQEYDRDCLVKEKEIIYETKRLKELEQIRPAVI